MKSLGLGFVTLVLQTSLVSGRIRYDLGGKNVLVADFDPAVDRYDEHNHRIIISEPGTDFKQTFSCDGHKQLTFSANQKFVACCFRGESLVGSPHTAFDCCGAGHDLAGSEHNGYRCCPTGQEYDGRVCRARSGDHGSNHHGSHQQPINSCQNGKVLMNGRCVCPHGEEESWENVCRPVNREPDCGRQPGHHGNGGNSERCSSGLTAGKCYTFTSEDGDRIGYKRNGGYYSAARDSRDHQFGKFQLCTSESCMSGSPINPHTGFHIRDIHGDANGGQNAGLWLDQRENGGHISKTRDFSKAGKFTISKWPCGKYCLSGFDSGIGPTCPSEEPAITFTTHDRQSCVPIEVMEVPCDIRAPENNCIWKNGNQCCDRVNCGRDNSFGY